MTMMLRSARRSLHTVGNVAASLPRQVNIVSAQGLVQAGEKKKDINANTPSDDSSNNGNPATTTSMIQTVLSRSLKEAQLELSDLDALIAVPSLREKHFMEAHYQATTLGMFQARPNLRCKTIGTGGAGPVSALLEGVRMIKYEGLECVAVVAADTVGSMSAEKFLENADTIFLKLKDPKVKSPAIPHGYDKLTQYQMETFGVTRDQLRMSVCLESLHAGLHPDSLFRQKELEKQQPQAGNSTVVKQSSMPENNNDILYTALDQVQEASSVTPNISILECARRADGAACILLTSNRFLARRGQYSDMLPTVIGVGEYSGPLYPLGKVDENHFSCEKAMNFAYASAGNLTAHDIDFFGLYDCFPVCLIRALESSGLCAKGQAGEYLQEQYDRMMGAIQKQEVDNGKHVNELLQDKSFWPVNTHGGLLCFGAPWEVPAMYNIIEAVYQLRGQAKGRQIQDCRRALVYGNGGILSASAVAILSVSRSL